MIGKIDGVMNGISVVGDRVGETLYYGPGAGGDATASAVVANIIDIVRSGKRSPMLGFNHPLEEGFTLKNPGDIRSKYYLRLRISDKPGMLAQITQLFADHSISVEAMLQRPYEEQCAHLLFSTHEALESDVCAMIKNLELLEAVLEKPFMIRII
jgi:homoserine dehydrogenase